MHHLLQYVPLCILLVAICGGFYELIRVVSRGITKIINRLNTQDTMLVVLNTRFDDHLKQHSGEW